MARRRKQGYWSSPGFWVAVAVGGAALVYALRPRTRVVATIGPAQITSYGDNT